jgi:hypothetical protein
MDGTCGLGGHLGSEPPFYTQMDGTCGFENRNTRKRERLNNRRWRKNEILARTLIL